MNPPSFPVNSTSELATLLGMSEGDLWRLANTTENAYRHWQEPKPSGGFRNLTSPKPQLKDVQKKLHKRLLSKIKLRSFSHCGIKGKSNITNAQEHVGSDVIFAFDLKSFFPSVRPERVRKTLIDELDCPDAVATLITKLVTVDYQLPQGAPTSTDIANIVTLRLQRRLSSLAKQWGIRKFTIYADDITFSGEVPQGFETMVRKIVKEEGYKIHPDKGGTFTKSDKQIVTGVNVAHGPNVGRLKRDWRAERHQNTKGFQCGKLPQVQFDASEKRYASRMAYATAVRKSGRKETT